MKEFIKECQAQVKNIVEELEMYTDNMYKCPRCGAVHSIDDLDLIEVDYTDDQLWYSCPDCGDEASENELEKSNIDDYFADCLDIEYRSGSGREYRSVRVMVACGGPNIYVDTKSKSVELYWGNTVETYPLSYHVVDAIDSYFEDIFMCY
jgi:predicted RNA-binding Zn-ribbon protein involved in translation (DUF1610 family)